MRVLIALGGNALLPRGVAPDAAIQEEHVAAVAPTLAAVGAKHQLIITHGNGPQVGLLAVESADDPTLHRPYPLDALVAETQGLIGYWLQRSIAAAGLRRPIVSLVTQTVVNAEDPAFATPTKFVGSCYAEADAHALSTERGWTVARDGEHWRRVVPSPAPVRIVETTAIRHLVERGSTVVCGGGGGVPVVETCSGLMGVEAVVDKDHVAALLALQMHCDLLVLLTDVPAVVADYDTALAHPLGSVTPDELEALEFAAGSMGPKVQAACRFARLSGHRTAVIGALDDLEAILAGQKGTRVAQA